MVWAAALVFLAQAPATTDAAFKEEYLEWLFKNAPMGWDVYEDGVWVSAGSDSTGSTYAIRMEDMKEPRTSDYKSVWLRGAHQKDKTRPYRTSKFKITFNCKSQTSLDGTWINYRADGGVHSTGQGDGFRYTDIIPGSIGDKWLKMVCATK